MTTPRPTPLEAFHRDLGARFTEFGGWWMPVQYQSILEEHRRVRSCVGLFDLCHMGEIALRGPHALEVVQTLITNDASKLRDGRALYSPICNPQGGVVDDVLVYRLQEDAYLLVVNASNIAKDWAWIEEVNAGRATLENQSDETALLALQGPKSAAVLASLTPLNLDDLYYYESAQTTVAGVPVLLSRTGYTGEDGFELYAAVQHAASLWEALLEGMRPHGGVPVGLGARDTLRLEMGYPLYGNELTEQTTPLEAGLRWTVAFRKPTFVGHEALRRQAAEGPARRLVGFEMHDRGIARARYPIFIAGQPAGEVTSGAPSPSLGKPIGMAYVPSRHASPGQPLDIMIHRRPRRAVVVRLPFYKPSVRRRSHAVR